jgi:hypothetical protein
MTVRFPLAALSRRFAAGALLVAVAVPGVQAQSLPAAKDLIQKWATATNAAGWKGHKSARSTAVFDLPAMGMSAKMETAQQFEPSMSVSRIDIPAMGEMRQGFDGKVAWMSNPMQGPSLITGPQFDAQREESNPDNYSRITPSIVSSETVEKTTLNNQECYKVKHTWKSGRISHDCFAVSDGMIVWTQTKTPTQMGEIEITTTFGGYKDFGGIKRAATTTVDQGGQQIIITLQTWEWDTVDPKEFDLPPEIKALTEKKP